MNRSILYIVFLLALHQPVSAQNFSDMQSPCTTSAQGRSGNFVINYTIGEMVLVQDWENNGLYITQGMMQPITILIDSAFDCFSRTEVHVYPNPNPGLFTLQLSILKPGNIQSILFDVSGKALQRDAFPYNTFTSRKYNISTLARGTYYLQLFYTEAGAGNTKKCVYTIQKTN